MKSKNTSTSYDLAEHNSIQISSFIIIILAILSVLFAILLPQMEKFFMEFLSGRVYCHGETIPTVIDSYSFYKTTNYFFNWAADIYLKTASENRIWLNPILSFLLPLSIVSFGFTIIISSLMPQRIGLMRHKIEREIMKAIEDITINKYGEYLEIYREQIYNELKNIDLRNIRQFSTEWGMSIENLKILSKAIYWTESSILRKLIHINDGIGIYMRYYFTGKYSNTVLGFVYIGAAVLIIIVGLRGLKFIPPTQPTLVLFALGLEFTLLIVYAFTLMYARPDDEHEGAELTSLNNEKTFLGSEFGSSKEIENLLRVFLKRKEK